jgi:hypothetical protein
MEWDNVRDYKVHAPWSHHYHSWTVDPRHDCDHGICHLQQVRPVILVFHIFELFPLSHLLSVCLVI